MQKSPISLHTLELILRGIRGTSTATVTYETDPKMVKKHRETKMPNPYDGLVVKRTTINVTLGFDYTNSVNNQKEREGQARDFVAQPRTWGERIKGTTLVSHKDAIYLEAKINGKPQENIFISIDTRQPIDKSILQPYLPVASTSEGRQGTEKEIVMRDIKLSSIKEIKLKGEHYVII